MRWNGWDAPQPYLVCKLGDPYRSVVCFVQGRGVLNECARVGPVEMERDGVNLLLQRSTITLQGQRQKSLPYNRCIRRQRISSNQVPLDHLCTPER